ncbi:putative endo-beta-1,4-glucanase B [Cytospora mali]|uniref:cellulase n=1 Tax=Cytospora mali TaxID=578113 RepID=A0A194W2J4_CYTMA|nr:putative endo-beta-1,4-glucanase B [Valsa mali]
MVASASAAPSSSSSVAAVAASSSVAAASSSPLAAASSSPLAATSSSAPVAAASSSSASAAVATSVKVASSSSSAAASSSSASSSSSSGNGTFLFLGASESGAEFGSAIPGTYGTDYTFPDTTAIQTLMDLGMNTFRLPFLMERIAQGTMTATLDATYLGRLKTVVKYVTDAGKYAVIDPHNYARYDGSIISSTSDFKTFWTNLATEFADDANVIFDCNNEPHDMSTATQTAELMQACVDGVRAAGATSQYIFVEGTSYTGAWTWTTSGNSENMGSITDTVDDKLVYEMHQYLDSDASGTSSTCVSTTIGAERLADATTWLRENNKVGIVGEFAGGANSDCETAVEGMLSFMQDNSDVWLGALWWGAGPCKFSPKGFRLSLDCLSVVVEVIRYTNECFQGGATTSTPWSLPAESATPATRTSSPSTLPLKMTVGIARDLGKLLCKYRTLLSCVDLDQDKYIPWATLKIPSNGAVS